MLKVRAVEGERRWRVGPLRSHQIAALLQHERHRGNDPGKDKLRVGGSDVEDRRWRRLRDVNSTTIHSSHELTAIGRGRDRAPVRDWGIV